MLCLKQQQQQQIDVPTQWVKIAVMNSIKKRQSLA